jgi:thioredoxin:protein disulfide reductase
LIIGAALGALHLSFKMSEMPEKVRKGLGVFLASAGIISTLAWLNKTEEKVAGSEPAIAWVTVKNTADATTAFDAALAQAKQKCMPVMIDFFAEWCIACKELDKYTYVDDDVKNAVRRFVSIKVDATEESAALAEIQTRFGVVGLPTIAFVDSTGATLTDPRITGFVGPKDYVPIVKRVR